MARSENPLASYFFSLAQKTDNLSSEETEKLLKQLNGLFGLSPEEDESLAEFFGRVSLFFSEETPFMEETITQGEIPENLAEMVAALEERERVIAEIKAKSSVDETLVKFGVPQSDVDRFINNLIARQAEEISAEITSAGKQTTAPETPSKLDSKKLTAVAVASFISKKQTKKALSEINIFSKTIANRVHSKKAVIFSAAVAVNTERIGQPPIRTDVAESGYFSEKVRKLPKPVREKLATVLVLASHEMTVPVGIPNTIIAPTVALILVNAGVTLTEEEGQGLVKKLIEVARPQAKAIAKELTPEETISFARATVKQVVNDHFKEIGLDVGNGPIANAIETEAETLISFARPGPFARAIAVTSVGKGKSSLEQENANLPPKLDIFSRIFRHHPASSTFLKANVSRQLDVRKKINVWTAFTTEIYRADPTNVMTSDLLLMDDIFRADEAGIAYNVSFQPFYQVAELVRPVTSKIFQSTVVKKLAETGVAKAARTGIEQAATKLAIKLGIETVAVKGGAAAIATALGIPTGGVSLLIWAAIEILKKIFDKIKKVINTLVSSLDKLTGGAISKLGNWIRSNFGGLAGKLFDWFGKPAIALASLLAAPAIIAITQLLMFAFVVAFAAILFFTAQNNQYFDALRPPLGGQGGDFSETEISGLEPFETDISYCNNLSGPAKIACVLVFVVKDPNCRNINGAVTLGNSQYLPPCLLASETMRSVANVDQINYIARVMVASANRWGTLQCVGFKAAVEPNLPPAGDAKHFAQPARISPNCHIVSSPQAGDNAVWTSGSFGHIAIVMGQSPTNPNNIIVAQAIGGTGIINFRSYVTASAIYIRCR